MSKRTMGIAMTIMSAVMFGFVPLCILSISSCGISKVCAGFYRFLFVVPLLYIMLKLSGESLKLNKREIKDMLLLAPIGMGLTAILLFTSYEYIPTGMTTTIHFMYPACTMLGLMLFCGEKPKPLKILALILCMIGIILFYDAEGSINLFGIFTAFLSSVTYAFYSIFLSRSSLKDVKPIKVTFYNSAISTVMVFLYTLLKGEFSTALSMKSLILAIVFSILITFAGVYGFQMGVKYVGPQNATILSTFEPIVSVMTGIIIYHESFGIKSLFACLAILTATVITARVKE